MDKIIGFLLLVLIVYGANAQDPDVRIFSDWYVLEYIEDGVSYLAPDNYPIEIFAEGQQDCPHTFYFPNPYHSSDGCIDFIANDQFIIQDLGILTEGEICTDGPQECKEFFQKYHPFYDDAWISGNPLSYFIVDGQNGKRVMTVTNTAGDQAIYSNQYLSVDDYAANKAIVYPNPVRERLLIDTNMEVTSVKVFSLNGILLYQSVTKSLDFTQFPVGLYFLEINYGEVREIYRILRI